MCQVMRAWKEMPGWTKPTRCPSQPGELRAWCTMILTGGEWREKKRNWSVPAAGAPLPEALEWGGDVFGQCRSRGWLPTIFDASQPWTFPQAKCRMDIVACLTGRHASLVEGAARGPWPWWQLGIHVESTSIIQSAKDTKSCVGGRQWPYHTTGLLVPGEIQGHAACRPMVWQPGLPTCAATVDPHLHKGPSILCRESPTTNPWWALPFGRVCWSSSRWWIPWLPPQKKKFSAAAMPSNGVEVTSPRSEEPTQWTPTAVAAVAAAKIHGPPQGIPNGSPWQRLTCCHWEEGWTCYSTTRSDDMTASARTQVLMPSTQVCRECEKPVGVMQPMNSHWCPCRRGWRVLQASEFLHNGNVALPILHFRWHVYWHVHLHDELCGPGDQPQGRRMPCPSSGGAFQFRLVTHLSIQWPFACQLCWAVFPSSILTMMALVVSL